jgi:hypothetical protein
VCVWWPRQPPWNTLPPGQPPSANCCHGRHEQNISAAPVTATNCCVATMNHLFARLATISQLLPTAAVNHDWPPEWPQPANNCRHEFVSTGGHPFAKSCHGHCETIVSYRAATISQLLPPSALSNVCKSSHRQVNAIAAGCSPRRPPSTNHHACPPGGHNRYC